MLSSMAISFEKRVSILPIGFESKKTIFARTIAKDMALCKFELLLITRLKTVISLIQQMIKLAPIKAPSAFG